MLNPPVIFRETIRVADKLKKKNELFMLLIHTYVTLDHKTSHMSHGDICGNSQQ